MKITGKISIGILALFLIGFALKSRYNLATNVGNGLATNVSEYAVKTDDVANGQQNKEDMTIYYAAEANTVILSFPQSQMVSHGRVFFVHPNSIEKNRTFALKLDPSKRMFIPIDDFEKAVWRVNVEWQTKDKLYSKEQILNIQPNNWTRPVH